MSAEEPLPKATPQDETLYHQATERLPSVAGFSGTGFDSRGRAIPYGVGPHSVAPMREALELAGARQGVYPFDILEIGTAQGYSSSIFLKLFPNTRVTSVDISDREETEVATQMLRIRYGERFRFFRSASSAAYDLVKDRSYQMIFIDGGHLEEDVLVDINLALLLKIPWIFFDDWQFRFGPGVRPAIEKSPIKIARLWWNMAMAQPK